MRVGRHWALGLIAPARRDHDAGGRQAAQDVLVDAALVGQRRGDCRARCAATHRGGRRYGPHELADALVAGTNGAPKRAQQNGEELDHRELAERCWDWFEAGVRLSEKEQKFIEDMMGWRKPSEKQLKWLKDIYARTIRRGA
jgi:hypothetical protein